MSNLILCGLLGYSLGIASTAVGWRRVAWWYGPDTRARLGDVAWVSTRVALLAPVLPCVGWLVGKAITTFAFGGTTR